MGSRRYSLGKRARKKEKTRRRIVRATAELHAEVGPAATTISAIAERAGVQRLTVYRHFPEESELFAACAAHTVGENPPPDRDLWRSIAKPKPRTEAALRALYAHYAGAEEMYALVLRDAERLPALQEALEPMRAYLESVADDLSSGWLPASEEDRRTFEALLGHALEFWTWRSLNERGLTAGAAAELMAGLLAETAGSPGAEAA